MPAPAVLAIDRLMEELAPLQHGLLTRRQLLAAGVTPSVVRTCLRRGRMRRLHGGVYQVGPLAGAYAREMAAVLACGGASVISHASAIGLARLRQQPGAEGDVHVTVVSLDRGCRPGIRRHLVRSLPTDEVTRIEGVPVTTVARTVLDVAATSSSGELRRIVSAAMRERGLDVDDLRGLLARYPRRPGRRLLRVLLDDEWPLAFTRSPAEERLLEMILRAQLPRPETNAWIAGCEVDFLWRRLRLVVEVDGFAHHGTRIGFENDRRRDAVLIAHRLRVMRVTWRQIETEAEAVLVRIAQALVSGVHD